MSLSQITLSGFFAINKPKDWTSHDVIGWLRPRVGTKTIGHSGTLDPMATGVLIVGIGTEYTKRLTEWHQFQKTYLATATLGATSNTDDAEGIVAPVSKKEPTESELRSALETFIGTSEQIPPAYSAKKINGKKSYDLARSGKQVELKPATITVHSIELLSYEYPLANFRVTCSTGTYIRSIARDLGNKLQVGAYLSALERESIGPVTLDMCTSVPTQEDIIALLSKKKIIENTNRK